MNTRSLLVAGSLMAASAALGQAGFDIEPIFEPGQTGITPRTPSCRVRAWARFSPNDWAVAGVRFDMLAADGRWSDNEVLHPLLTGSNPGVVNGPSVTGVIAGQLNFFSKANPSNPIGVWEATWATSDFTPRRVPLQTRTSRFDVYPDRNSPSSAGRMFVLTEGAAGLEVWGCYPDCDGSTGVGTLDVFDFLCFLNRYEFRSAHACECDTATGTGVCDVLDFLCFQNAFVVGCP